MSDTVRLVALVTGGNKGIGRAVVEGLARRGMTVMLGARDAQRGRRAAEELAEAGDVRFVQLDVTDPESVRRAATVIERDCGRLDVLVNNAGISVGFDRPRDTTADAMRRTFETNVFGVVTVTRAFLNLLLQSPAGRIVNVSSHLGQLGTRTGIAGAPTMAYSTSKTALNAVTVQYARDLADTPIKVNAAAPGYTATDLNNHRGTRSPAEAAEIIIRLATLEADGPTGGFFDDRGLVPW